MAWYLGFAAERPMTRVFFRLCPLIMVPGVILTGSRGGTVAMCVALMIIPLCFKQISTLTKSLVVATLLAAVVGGVTLLPDASVKRLSSIGSEAMSGSMAGRREIWAAGWEQFKQHPVLGVGTGGFAESINLANSQNPVAHNTYLSVVTELGVIGFLIYFLAVIRMGLDALHMPKPERWLWLSVLFAWIIGVSTLTWEHTKAPWLIFALILTRARLFNSEQEHQEDEWENEVFLPSQS
jgi:O-antigen ligase